MNSMVKDSSDANGNPAADRLDLSVGYSIGLERLVELLRESLQSEILLLEDKIGGTKATTTMIEGAVGS